MSLWRAHGGLDDDGSVGGSLGPGLRLGIGIVATRRSAATCRSVGGCARHGVSAATGGRSWGSSMVGGYRVAIEIDRLERLRHTLNMITRNNFACHVCVTGNDRSAFPTTHTAAPCRHCCGGLCRHWALASVTILSSRVRRAGGSSAVKCTCSQKRAPKGRRRQACLHTPCGCGNNQSTSSSPRSPCVISAHGPSIFLIATPCAPPP